jgi:hypothetical protein
MFDFSAKPHCIDNSLVGAIFKKSHGKMIQGVKNLWKDMTRVPKYKECLKDCRVCRYSREAISVAD